MEVVLAFAAGGRFGHIPEGMRCCPECNGYGSSLAEESERCTHCARSGLVLVAEPSQEGPKRHDPSRPEQQD